MQHGAHIRTFIIRARVTLLSNEYMFLYRRKGVHYSIHIFSSYLLVYEILLSIISGRHLNTIVNLLDGFMQLYVLNLFYYKIFSRQLQMIA